VKWLTPVKPEKRLSSECAVSLLSHPVWRRRRRRRRRRKMRGPPPPPVIRPPNAAADHQFFGAQL